MSDLAGPILDHVVDAAEKRQFARHTISAYRRTWLSLIARATAERLEPAALPTGWAQNFYGEATQERSASHRLQVKAALAFLYRTINAPNPFTGCQDADFRVASVQLRVHSPSQLGHLLQELRDERHSYFGHLTYHLALALFTTGCRYGEWAMLRNEQLVRDSRGEFRAARMGEKGKSSREVALTTKLSESLREWGRILESVKGVRLRGGGIEFAASPLVFPGRDGGPFSNQAFNARMKAACERARVPIISAHPLRHTAAALMLSEEGATLRDVQTLLNHKSIATTARYRREGFGSVCKSKLSV